MGWQTLNLVFPRSVPRTRMKNSYRPGASCESDPQHNKSYVSTVATHGQTAFSTTEASDAAARSGIEPHRHGYLRRVQVPVSGGRAPWARGRPKLRVGERRSRRRFGRQVLLCYTSRRSTHARTDAMTPREEILSRFGKSVGGGTLGSPGAGPVFMPDLSLW